MFTVSHIDAEGKRIPDISNVTLSADLSQQIRDLILRGRTT